MFGAMNNFIKGSNRNQMVLIPDCLENVISMDNEVRTIDLFVEALDIQDYGFEIKNNKEGRPCYHPKTLLKLFIYGYLNSIRSSRKLEKECKINIELMWLMNQLVPDHNTISNFRKDNTEAIRAVFKATVSLAKHFDLIGGKLLAGDSTKFRAQNSKKNNYNPKKIERHLEYIDNKLSEYHQALSEADGDQEKSEIQKEINKHEGRKEFYKTLSETIEQTGETQISTSDPESRQMITRNNITEVAYNAQVTTDSKHGIPIDYLVTNQNDSKAMGEMLERTAEILQTKEFTALYDKVIEQNKQRIEQNKEKYRRRQAIVEHPFGTLKRQWGFSYIMTKKGKERASSDVGFMFTAYNLRRIMNLIDPEILKKYLRVLCSIFSELFDSILAVLSPYFFPSTSLVNPYICYTVYQNAPLSPQMR